MTQGPRLVKLWITSLGDGAEARGFLRLNG